MSKQELQYYKENCRQLDTRTFPQVKERALSFITSPDATPTGVLLFSEWFFNKLFYLWKMPASTRKDIYKNIVWAVDGCKSIPIKMGYLQWRDVEFTQTIMHYFFMNRFDATLFIEQMLNDSNLLKWSQNLVEPAELLEHFLKWIETVSTFEQKSNLLDVLLRFFPEEERVKNVYKVLMNGDTLYANEQSAHDEDIGASVKKVLKELYFWIEENKVYKASSGQTRTEWVKSTLLGTCESLNDTRVLEGIFQRLAIDKTVFEIRDDTNRPINIDAHEVLFMIVNYISYVPSDIGANMFRTLLEEMREAVDLCITGYVVRFVNAIQGYGKRFQISIPFRKQLQAKISHDISKKMNQLPADSNVILGTYDEEYKKEYFDFIVRAIDMRALIDQYGPIDVATHLPFVLKAMTDSSTWSVANDVLFYT